jgi:hypothetical protein
MPSDHGATLLRPLSEDDLAMDDADIKRTEGLPRVHR